MNLPHHAKLRRAAAFTMVEIAISLAIIGFALVTIIGVLPVGLGVQRENREETIINQDASVFLNAIRSGDRGLDDLTNYVDAITNIVTTFDANGNIIAGSPHFYGYTYANSSYDGVAQAQGSEIINGARIIGLLSTPKYTRYHDLPNLVVAESNYVVANVRAMSGAATEKMPQTNIDVRDLSFNYRMISEVVPYVDWDTNWVSYNAPGLTPEEIAARQSHWRIASNTHSNLADVRLIFRWPLLANGKTGHGRQTFRTTVGGQRLQVNDTNLTLYFFQPNTF